MSKKVGEAMSAFIDLHPAQPSPKPIAYKFRPAISEVKRVSLALQGGSAHGAFTWGVLDRLLEEPRIEVEGVSATSAGANERGRDGSWPDHGRAKRRARGARRVLARRSTDQCPIWRAAIVRTRLAVSVALSAQSVQLQPATPAHPTSHRFRTAEARFGNQAV